jgi:hypothetical protein
MPLFYHLFNYFAQICAGKEYFLVPLHPEKRKRLKERPNGNNGNTASALP